MGFSQTTCFSAVGRVRTADSSVLAIFTLGMPGNAVTDREVAIRKLRFSERSDCSDPVHTESLFAVLRFQNSRVRRYRGLSSVFVGGMHFNDQVLFTSSPKHVHVLRDWLEPLT